MDTAEMMKALAAPFAPADVEWRVSEYHVHSFIGHPTHDFQTVTAHDLGFGV